VLVSTGRLQTLHEAFEKAAAAEPSNSKYQNWLGRAYGRRAESSNPLSAPGLAVKARTAFEKAVDLNPANIEAMNDLFSYYIEAPGFLGGGLDKAEALAEKMKSRHAAEYHAALARLADRRKQPEIAERHLRAPSSWRRNPLPAWSISQSICPGMVATANATRPSTRPARSSRREGRSSTPSRNLC